MNRRDFCASAAALGIASASARAAPGPVDADTQLAALLNQLYATALAESPELVSQLGIDSGARANSKSMLHQASLAARDRRRAITRAEVAALRRIDRTRLSPRAAIDYDAILYDRATIDRANRQFAYGTEIVGAPYVISQIDGAYCSIPEFLSSQHTIAVAGDCDAYLSRLTAFARLMDEEGGRVRHDAAVGAVPPNFAIQGALAQTKLLRVGADQSSLVTMFASRAAQAGIAGDWAGRASDVYTRRVLPALDRQVALLETLLPKASPEPGVWRLPDGEAYYAQALRNLTSTDLPAEEVHRIGLDLTRDLQAQAETQFARLGMTKGSLADRFNALFHDPKELYPDSDQGRADEIAALNTLVVAMQKKLPAYFGTLPKAPLEIRRISTETEAGQSTHYTPGSLDGTRPGVYWLNMREMGEAPFFDMPTTTFHEGVPGHHLQISLQNQADLPDARKILLFNGYVEGWALYAEQLALEMGFFEGHPSWQLGYLHDALLRAGRLVTDTGMHAKRWSRAKAEVVLHETVGDPLALCRQEIERYACWPGQACGYMVGKISILKARERARRSLGERFDIRRFHDAVLLSGALPLTVLDAKIDMFVRDEQSRRG